ncbi:hypothetical protein K6959_14485 [Bacillus aquiflavi]|uniref:hypothetical protein n=1 Tax=Bacillus aquiflavi TaxID=2672567 RepID=UPI001CA7D281|nr:hypothetical protein [Bacillus aquiflavi]UAC47808.1 hypothetical protein K6959_14485 [Bacillus aquiflavi]
MNFEAKHLIRWGIPGWVYISFVFLFFLINDQERLFQYLAAFDVSIVGLTAVLTGLGIIVGHIIHQMSMLFGFIIWTNWRVYFKKEYNLDKIIMNHKVGKDIRRIYSYRLGQVHALRALSTSGVLSSFTLLLLMNFYSFSLKGLMLLAVSLLVTVVTLINHYYFKRNFDFFIKQIRRDYREH